MTSSAPASVNHSPRRSAGSDASCSITRILVTSVLQLDDHRSVVGRQLALALLPIDQGAGHPAGQLRAGQREVDPHAATFLERQLGVVPVGVDAGTGRERPHHVGESRVDQRAERLPLGRGDVRGVAVVVDAPDVVVGRRDVEVTAEGDLRVRLIDQLLRGVIANRGQPLELVVVVRVADRPAVRHVQAPHPHARAQCTYRPRLGDGRIAPGREPRDPDLDVIQTHPGQHRDAVPLIGAVVRDLVTELGEPFGRKLLIRDLGLLDGDHIDVAARQPRGQPVDPSTDRIDVPGGNTHSDQPKTGAGGGAGTKNGTVHSGRDSPSILARQPSTCPGGSGSPVLKYSTTWDLVGSARRGTPLPRKLGSSICSVWPNRITRDPGTAEDSASSIGVPLAPSRTTSNAYCSLNRPGGKVRLTTSANAADTPVLWSRPINCSPPPTICNLPS